LEPREEPLVGDFLAKPVEGTARLAGTGEETSFQRYTERVGLS